MQITRIEVSAKLVEVERNLAGGVRAVNDRDDALRRRTPTYLGHREDQGGQRGDVANDQRARLWRDALPELLDEVLGADDGQRNRLAAIVRALRLADERPGALDRAVFM